MELVLRIYTIKPGEMDDWIEEWRAHFLRTEGLAAANAAYYDSPERAALDPDPARHIAGARQLTVRALELE